MCQIFPEISGVFKRPKPVPPSYGVVFVTAVVFVASHVGFFRGHVLFISGWAPPGPTGKAPKFKGGEIGCNSDGDK